MSLFGAKSDPIDNMKPKIRNEQTIKLAKNLKKLMAVKNLTITSVSRQVGMNKSTLHNYCNGVVPRNLLKIKELADLLGISLNELIFGENANPSILDLNAQEETRFEIVIKRVRNNASEEKLA